MTADFFDDLGANSLLLAQFSRAGAPEHAELPPIVDARDLSAPHRPAAGRGGWRTRRPADRAPAGVAATRYARPAHRVPSCSVPRS